MGAELEKPDPATTSGPTAPASGETALSDQADSAHAETQKPRKSRTRRTLTLIGQIAFGFLLALTLVLAWPAAWGGRFTFGVVSGTSMLPQLLPGDLVVAVRNTSNEYDIGDTVLYFVNYQGTAGRIVHKIVGVNSDGTYITQGVNKRDPDPWSVVPADVQGRVFASFSNGQTIINVIKSPNFIPLAFGLYLVWMFWPRRKKKPADTDSEESVTPGENRLGDSGQNPK